jgi:parallel beta-helix repeat protein
MLFWLKLKKLVLVTLVLILFSSVAIVDFIEPVEAGVTIYIRADGSVEGTTTISTVDNVTYTFTDNIVSQSIIVERNNIVVDGADHIIQGTGAIISTGIFLHERSNVTIKNFEIEAFDLGICVDECSNNTLSGNNITSNKYGIYAVSSSNNNIYGNNITSNDDGIFLYSSSNNTLSGNNITSNKYGIYAVSSSNNNIYGNNITSNDDGIFLYSSSNNTLSGNNIRNNNRGIYLEDFSNNNSIVGNNVTANNYVGIAFYRSSQNSIYHNTFLGNNAHASCYNSKNIWDYGYPSGGNYWSNYTGADWNGDGIGDSPYVIDENNQDNYPLMSPWSSPRSPFWMQWWFWTIVAVVIVALVGAVYFLKKRKSSTPPITSTEAPQTVSARAYLIHMDYLLKF